MTSWYDPRLIRFEQNRHVCRPENDGERYVLIGDLRGEPGAAGDWRQPGNLRSSAQVTTRHRERLFFRAKRRYGFPPRRSRKELELDQVVPRWAVSWAAIGCSQSAYNLRNSNPGRRFDTHHTSRRGDSHAIQAHHLGPRDCFISCHHSRCVSTKRAGPIHTRRFR